MFYALSWFLVLALLTAWSVCVWVLHSVVAWSLTGVGALANQTQQMERLTLPEWVAVWVPSDVVFAVQTSLAGVLPLLESVFSALPSAAPWLGLFAWVVWGFGFLVLGVGGMLLHALISMATRKAAVA